MPRQPLAPAAAASAVADQPGKPSPDAATHTSAAARPKTCDSTSTVRTCSCPRRQAAEEIAEPPREARAESQRDREQLIPDGPGRRDGVELVRVVEDGRLGRAGSVAVVVRRDRVQELGERVRGRARRRAPRSAAGPDGRGRAGVPPRSRGTRGRGSARAPGRRRAGARPRAGGRRAAEDGAGRSRARASRRRPCARAGRLRRRGASRRPGGRASPSGSPRRRGASPRAPRARDARARRRGTRGSRRARRRRVASAGPGRPDRRPSPRPSGSRAAAGCRSSRRGRAREPRRPRRSGRRAARRRSRSALRSFPSESTSSSTRYGAPFLVVRRCLRATAYTPSTVRSAVSSAMVLTRLSLGRW